MKRVVDEATHERRIERKARKAYCKAWMRNLVRLHMGRQ